MEILRGRTEVARAIVLKEKLVWSLIEISGGVGVQTKKNTFHGVGDTERMFSGTMQQCSGKLI